MREVFRGSCVALITPFTADGIDFAALKKIIEFQIQNGTDALLILGTTGEPSTMTTAEKHAVLEFAIKTVAKRIPVIAGTGGNNTANAICDSQFAEKAGADALLVVTPYYNKCTQGGLIKHYHMIGDSVNLPIIVYNVPGRTGVNIAPSTMVKIAEHKNISGIKEASGNIEQICEVSRLVGQKISVYSGDDGITLPIIALGGKGIISVTANIIPAFMHDLASACLAGDFTKALPLHEKLYPFAKAMFCEVNPIPIKTAASLLGLCSDILRMPLTNMEDANLLTLKKAMVSFGLEFVDK